MLARKHAALDICDPGATQPAGGAFEAAGRDVASDELALVPHGGCQCQGLAAGAGAKIDDPHAGLGAGDQGGELRAFVLDIEEARLERGEAGKRRPLAKPQPDRRQWRRLCRNPLGGERVARRLAIGLDQVDPEVDRRRPVEGRHLVLQSRAEGAIEMRLEPFRQIVCDRARHLRMAQGAGCEAANEPHFGVARRRRAKTVAVAALEDRFGPPPFGQHQPRQYPAARPDLDMAATEPRDPPIERRAMAQHGIDMAGDPRPILGADIAPAAEIIGGDIIGGTAGFDRDEDLDRGGDLGARGQRLPGVTVARVNGRPGSWALRG